MVIMVFTSLCLADCMCILTRSATGVPTSELEADEDSSVPPDLEMGAPKAAEDHPENDSEKHSDKLVTAIT